MIQNQQISYNNTLLKAKKIVPLQTERKITEYENFNQFLNKLDLPESWASDSDKMKALYKRISFGNNLNNNYF